MTRVLSRVPRLDVFVPARNEKGEFGRRPTGALVHGQVFGVVARFLEVLGGRPSGQEIRVRLAVEGGDTIEVPLTRINDPEGRLRVFISRPLQVVPLGAQPSGEEGAPLAVRAAPGTTLRALYGAESASQAVTVRERPVPRTGPGTRRE